MLKKQGYEGQLKIRERERLSEKPFGLNNSKGKFRFDIEKVPFYNVPSLTGFKLKPYVPYTAPQIDIERKVTRQVNLDDELLKNIEIQIEKSTRG